MRHFLLLFFAIAIEMCICKKVLKVINTPVFSSIPVSLLHNVVLFEANDVEKYAIDFSPSENIESPNVILKLLLGKTIQGRIRVSCFSKELCQSVHREPFTSILYSTKNDFFEKIDSQITDKNLNKIDDIDPHFVNTIKSWDLSYQIYKRNCRHFTQFLLQHHR